LKARQRKLAGPCCWSRRQVGRAEMSDETLFDDLSRLRLILITRATGGNASPEENRNRSEEYSRLR
jgi:hypothetical protein